MGETSTSERRMETNKNRSGSNKSEASTRATTIRRSGEKKEKEKENLREELNAFLARRPSAAEVVSKGVIPRSVIDEGQASWQVPDRKPSSSGVVAKRSRASKKRKETYAGRLSQRIQKARDPVSIVAENMAPRKQEQKNTKQASKAKTIDGPTGRTAVGPSAFNLQKLREKLVPKRHTHATKQSSLNTITETNKKNNDLEALQVHAQKMKQLKARYVKERKNEIGHKHRTNKNKFSPDTPPQVKYLHSKFRQVFQPFQKNSDKYSETHQLKTGNRANAGEN